MCSTKENEWLHRMILPKLTIKRTTLIFLSVCVCFCVCLCACVRVCVYVYKELVCVRESEKCREIVCVCM